jgi:hypothetical protein
MPDILFRLDDAPHGGKRMQSRYELGDDRVLDVYTAKRSNGAIATTATVSTLRNGLLTHAVYSDFSKTLIQERGIRATAKAVEAQHKSVNAEELKAEVAAYHEQAEAKGRVVSG